MSKPLVSIDEISKIFLKTAQHTLETSTKQEITYAKTIQKTPKGFNETRSNLFCSIQWGLQWIGGHEFLS